MPPIRTEAADRIHRDHDYIIELAHRIKAACTQGGAVDNCDDCHSSQRQVCHGNINGLIRLFVETAQKHNLYEVLLMHEGVPLAHRIAHQQAHLALADEMKAIRVVFSAHGDCVVAIDGIDRVLETLVVHGSEFDQQLEAYLMTPV